MKVNLAMHRYVLWLALLINMLFFVFFLLTNADNVIVNTLQGSLEGVVEQSRSGRAFYSFYGIPYAEPPLDGLRFANPIPPKPWQGIRNATVWPTPCLSLEMNKLNGNEDCLYLNVYTPKISYSTDNMPVIVFIYGGAFMYDHALPNHYGPHYFMDKDVILITFHYRIGTLGFISTGDHILPGNYGLKDMVAVLRWVHKNVENFNGDKSRVTLMGGSCGGAMAAQALISPLTKDLFHRCITQSGTPNFVLKRETARKNAWKIASLVGCNGVNVSESQDLINCLRKVPAEKLIETHSRLFESEVSIGEAPRIFGPVIEDEIVPGAFLIDDPSKLLSRRSNIPWLNGINSDDGGLWTTFMYYNLMNETVPQSYKLAEKFEEYFPRITLLNEKVRNRDELKEVAHKLKNYFFGDTDIRVNPKAYTNMITVSHFIVDLKKNLRLYRGPAYAYYYAHRNRETFVTTFSGGYPTDELGVIHGDELISMFNWSERIKPVTEGIDFAVSERVLDLWTNFITHGNPNPENGEQIWKRFDPNDPSYLYIKDNTFEMISDEELFGSLNDIIEYISKLHDSNT